MSWLKRRGRIGHRLNRFNSFPCHPRSVLAVARCVLLAGCPLRLVALVLLAAVSLIRLAHRPVVRVVPLLSARLLVSFRRFAPSCLPIGYVRLVSSAHPLRPLASSCLPAPSLVSSGGASSSRSHLVMRFACRPCVLAYRPSFHSLSGCGCGCHRFAHAFRCYRAASAPSRLCGRVLLSACLCYTVCRGDVDHRIRGIRARSHKPPQLTGGGVVVVFQFS